MKDRFSRIKNWWWYNKTYVLIALLAAAAVIYMFVPSKEAKPDYHVALVSAIPCAEEDISRIEARLASLGEDQNGDGKVIVRLHSYAVDLADSSPNAGSNNYERVAALDADLVGKVSQIFILDAPEVFQRVSNSLLAEPVIPFEDGFSVAIRRDADAAYIELFKSLT